MATQSPSPSDSIELSLNMDDVYGGLTLKSSINDNFIDLYDYEKHDGKKRTGNKTGKGVLMNLCKDLAVIDLDIPHELDDEKKISIREDVLEKLPRGIIAIKTGNGGLHIYCRLDSSTIGSKSNRMTKIMQIEVKCVPIDIDIFTSTQPEKRSLVVFAGSLINGGKSKYEFIRGDIDSPLVHSLDDLLDEMREKFDVEKDKLKMNKPIKDISTSIPPKTIIEKKKKKEYDNSWGELDVSKDVVEALVNGIEGFEIHNCTNKGDNGDEEATLLVMFKAINCIDDKVMRENAYCKCLMLCTEKARERFLAEKERQKDEKSSLGMLMKIIKNFNHEYYISNVKPLLGCIVMKKFDLDDDFDLDKFDELAHKQNYKSLCSAASDLSRIYRYHRGGEDYFIEKDYDLRLERKVFRYVKKSTVKDKLKTIFLFNQEISTPSGKIKLQPRYAWDAFIEYQRHFNFYDIMFNSDKKKVISYFHGYKYKGVEQADLTIISDYLKLIREVIAHDNEEVYEYILNWISFIMQNPGKKAAVSLVLKGTQGCGKNTFTDILCELMSGYSQGNVTDLDDLIGPYNKVLENCMFMVLNEMRSMRDSYVQNIDRLKSIITDPTYRISEKFEPRRTVENVCNFVFISNHAKPLIIPPNDRRYLVLNASDKYVASDFLVTLHGRDRSFYEHLTAYFLSRDISGFNPFKIPMTDAKRDIIAASRTPCEDWIVENYNDLVEGMTLLEVKEHFSSYFRDEANDKMFWKNFQLQLKDKCINGGRYQKRRDERRVWVYKLTEQNEKVYKTEHTPAEEEWEEIKLE